MADRNAGVRVEGLREFRRDLRRVSPALDKELRGDIKKITESVAAEARGSAVRRTGAYAASIRAYAGGVVGSRLPQAGVLHWGGTIRPRGVDITFRARPVVLQAVEHQSDRIVDRMGDAVDRAAKNAGWK
jgi:hypothetical protein